jgi:hypothetical protein
LQFLTEQKGAKSSGKEGKRASFTNWLPYFNSKKAKVSARGGPPADEGVRRVEASCRRGHKAKTLWRLVKVKRSGQRFVPSEAGEWRLVVVQCQSKEDGSTCSQHVVPPADYLNVFSSSGIVGYVQRNDIVKP